MSPMTISYLFLIVSITALHLHLFDYVGKIGTPDSDKGQFKYPYGVTVSFFGFDLVTESGNHALCINI